MLIATQDTTDAALCLCTGSALFYTKCSLDDLTFLVATHVPEAHHVVAKHLIGYATLQYMSRGELLVQYDQRHYQIEGEWFWPAYPGPYTVFQRAAGCESWSHRHLAFQGSLINRWIANGIWPTEPQRPPHTRDWAAYFDEMSRLAMTTTRWARLRAVNMLEGLLLELAEARAEKAPQDPWLESVLNAVQQDGNDYGLIALNHGMALSTLRRRFQKATGTSIHQHALQARIAKARTLLLETNLPIKAIADSLGYENVFYFTRQFTKTLGVSPGRFRSTR